MRHAVILAGGSGTRLWPWSRAEKPKQLLPLAGEKTLLELAFDRLENVVPASNRCVCGAEGHRGVIRDRLGNLPDSQYIGEPVGRDTVNALGLCAAVLRKRDPGAVMGVSTADHIIEPVDTFRDLFARGFQLAEANADALVTFGIPPTVPSTAYGYLELGDRVEGGDGASVVTRFREKPDAETAESFLAAGPGRYLWNSGMFVWRAATLLDCIERYEPGIYAGLQTVAEAWDTPRQAEVLGEVFPMLKKISVDFAVMEPASADPKVRVMAVPMDLSWVDVGSWNAFAGICEKDGHGNAFYANRRLVLDTSGTLIVSSEPDHLVATLGCEDLIVIHTPDATLVAHADQAEKIKQLHKQVGERFGKGLV